MRGILSQMKTKVKGIHNGRCKTDGCKNINALYFNVSNMNFYCKECADALNAKHRARALDFFGGELCIYNPNTEEYI